MLQLVAFTELVRSHVPERQFKLLFRSALIGLGLVGLGGFVGLTLTGTIAPWTGRFYSLWDTEYAKKSVQALMNPGSATDLVFVKVYPHHRLC